MIQKIKKLLEIYKRERYFEKNKDAINPQTGLTSFERNRLSKFPPFTKGKTNLFGLPFMFSDALAFLHSLDEIFSGDIYKFNAKSSTPLIIDCGSNIGLSIYYFARQYPQSKIIAFEPDPEIFSLLKENVKTFSSNSNIELHEAAVWTDETELEFFIEGTLGGSINVDYRNKKQIQKVKAIDLKNYLSQKVDFLKIDIEGAENKVIFDIQPYLHNIDKMFLEFHGLLDEKQNLADILSLLTKNNFEYYIRVAGETLHHPFCDEKHHVFNQQLNIFCYRRK